MNPRARRLAIVLCVPLLLLIAAESVVRTFGLDPRDRPRMRMFKTVVRDGVLCFQRDPQLNRPWSPPYRVDKPEGRLRIACLGGSSVELFDQASFPRVLERLVQQAVAPREAEVIGAGYGGMYSDGELMVLRELIDRDLDAVVLYSLHNEFHPMNVRTLLDQRTRPWRARLREGLGTFALGRLLIARMTPPKAPEQSVADVIPDHRPIDGPEYELVVEHFRENLETFYELCRSRGVPLLVCTVVSNLRELPPIANVFDDTTGEPDRARWEALVDEAEQAAEAGDPERAHSLLDEAEAIDDKPARLAYVRGQALLAAGRDIEARVALSRARDTDGRTSRAVSGVTAIVHGMEGRPGLTVVDIEATFDERAPHGIAGHELIIDHLHPSVLGHGLIAARILRAMGDAELFTTEQALRERGLHDPEQVLATLVDTGEMRLRKAQSKLQIVLEKGRWDVTAKRTRADLVAVLRVDPERTEALVGLGLLEGLARRTKSSGELFRRALDVDADALAHWRSRARTSPLIRSILDRAGVLEPQTAGDG